MGIATFVFSSFMAAAPMPLAPASPLNPPIDFNTHYTLASRGSREPNPNKDKNRRQRKKAPGFYGWEGEAFHF